MEKVESKVPYFETVAGVREAQFKKGNFLSANLYPRDGYLSLFELEDRVSRLVGVEPEQLILYSSGMSAVVDALEISNPTQEKVIIHGEQLYNQSLSYIQEVLTQRGVKVVRVDPGSIDEVTRAITIYRPQVVFLETVANGPDMPVLDVVELLSSNAIQDCQPLIILDNTLPTPSVLTANMLMSSYDRTLVIESGTKFYSLNQEICGLIYTGSNELLRELRKRRRFGSILCPSATERIEGILLSKEEFDQRNTRIISNTFSLAKACFAAEGERFLTIYPNLATHPNFEFASTRYPDGVSPVLFIQLTDFRNLDQFKLTEKLWENSVIRRFCKLGQSFGFDQTRIWPDPNYPAIRISGGTENQTVIGELVEAFKETLSNLCSFVPGG